MIKPVPGWSWREDLDASQKADLAERIITELDARLGANAGPRVYAVAGHPHLSARVAPALAPFMRGGTDFRTAAPDRPDIYITSDPDVFARILPSIFEWGPPEIMLVAIPKSAIGDEEDGDAALAGMLDGADAAERGAVGMYFDSGDLMRMF